MFGCFAYFSTSQFFSKTNFNSDKIKREVLTMCW